MLVCDGTLISNLFFADDFILYSKATLDQAQNIKAILNSFVFPVPRQPNVSLPIMSRQTATSLPTMPQQPDVVPLVDPPQQDVSPDLPQQDVSPDLPQHDPL
ncbi:hypothetical protein V6N11_002122 [Hibiscus sabdariffa]|uniref:Reverse transcriptase domain-containing protein n=1 Tax=Hibiscus sabdariffa TaxID=183260 RepID=A0ABR2QUE1_9ROSI